MILTTDFITNTFDKYNKLYWSGKLRKPTFIIKQVKSQLGTFSWGNGKWQIMISNYYNRDEKGYTETILHEMVHLYIRQNNIKDTRRHHGKYFYAEADRINSLGGWNIKRTTDIKGCERNGKKETYHVIAYKDGKGRYFQMCCNPKKVDYFKGYMKNNNYFKKVVFFTSTDNSKFSTYPKCIKSCRGWFISKEEFDLNCKIPNAEIMEQIRPVA